MRNGGTLTPLLPLLVALLAPGCNTSPTEPEPACRRYPTAFLENGDPFTCTLEPGNGLLRCVAGVSRSRSWTYANIADFIEEARVPNRVLATERESASSGGLLISFSSTTTELRYDVSRRLLERRRVGSNAVVDEFEIDVLLYTAWDGRGRPTEGLLRAGEREESIRIAYDDRSFRAEASNGELTIQDGQGNLLREVSVFGLGDNRFVTDRNYVIQSMAEICR